ncbi:hypothetical protein [Mitsuaria sp. GD03876]|uniref:hypothetical protein n=1 Tax=Mitsuaria sp. GD03876 TaxID=2975399 RepID=UPI00244AD42C|nr:hypothetical protein [Mitsuaria sp. GD03876]MDH0864976.1 hypothetical protein [Mitsuaria sp. GD03876]
MLTFNACEPDSVPLTPTAPLESIAFPPASSARIREDAQRQEIFYDDVRLTPTQFRATPNYHACSEELLRLTQWLAHLLPDAGPDADVAADLARQAPAWARPERMDHPEAQWFGAGKHLMFELCKALARAEDRKHLPDLQSAVCRALRPALDDDAGRAGISPITAVGRALSAAWEAEGASVASYRRRQASEALEAFSGRWLDDRSKHAEMARAMRQYLGLDEVAMGRRATFGMGRIDARAVNGAAAACARAWNAPVQAESMPGTTSPVLAALLSGMTPEALKTRHAQLNASVDRLIRHADQLPARAAAPARAALAAWRQALQAAPEVFDEHDAAMYCTGPLLLNRLCDELDRMTDAKRQQCLLRLGASYLPTTGQHYRIDMLAPALIEAESCNAGRDNPHLAVRRQRLLDWAEPQVRERRLTQEHVSDALEMLGLERPETSIDGVRAVMDLVRNNAALRACLLGARNPKDPLHLLASSGPVDPLADIGRADLAEALTTFRKRCQDFFLYAEAKDLEAFEARWLGATPTRGQDDLVGNLQSFGVEAMNRLLRRATEDTHEVRVRRDTVAGLATALKTAKDPAGLLMRYARYELPERRITAAEQAALDDKRRLLIKREVRAGLSLLEGQAEADIERAVARTCRLVQDRLGVRPARGDTHEPGDEGLIDLSTANLSRINLLTRNADALVP